MIIMGLLPVNLSLGYLDDRDLSAHAVMRCFFPRAMNVFIGKI